MTLLRGFMYISLNEAQDLPDCDTAFFNISGKDTSDPYAQVKLGTNVICKTAYINNNINPIWQESYRIPICHEVDIIKVMVLDKDHIGACLIGEYEVRVEDLLEGGELDGWYPLSGCDGQINMKLSFVPLESIEYSFEVPDCYFPMKEGCKVRLYQDAHCPTLPLYESVPTASGDLYDPPCAWTDLYKSLKKAEKFIYITGWSVFADIVLVRECCKLHSEGVGDTVGDLLKRKADEGVRVLLLIWNEKLSTEVTPGLMGTHDEETRDYFLGSNVEVAVVPRMRVLEGFTSYIRNQFSETCYTHHQKTIILDADPPEGEELRRVIAFVGGLDITNGRWDTPEHELFKTLSTKHSGDFYNGCVQTTEEVGPRQPWHDIHCKVEGPIVMDILANFNERWRQQASEMLSRLKVITDEEFAIDAPAPVEDEAQSWNVQLFRSISSDSASFDFDRISTIPKRKGKYVDDSIHRAYIHHIRKAEKFLFFENQYFLGSAYCWEDETDTKAYHLIPAEIAHKIVDKINSGDHFCAYVIIPMFPEGDPASKPVQEILHWQWRTMGMMYKKIAAAIEANELDTHPTDYLSIFCLGKGESSDEIPEDLPPPDPETAAAAVKIREQARFMIYVHSKMMIVDDDYILIGSANINQRSMGGTRDTEIAVGCFQPAHTRETAEEGLPRGTVYEFRSALWSEHLGGAIEEVHTSPGTVDCMRAVNEAAQSNWEKFITSEPCHLDAHLLKYPIKVEQDGTVAPLDDNPNFPETEAPVVGAPNYLPNKLTT
uniref:phospholipase D n=3 Tax=Hirondellea gigas TaxID=1518452 RepID=A0A6A7FYI4_9CRUS